MKKSNKTLIISALAALAFGAGAVGSTFALFTNTAEANVTVTAGKVSVAVEITSVEAYSPTAIAQDGTVTNDKNAANGTTFACGGTVSYEGSNITIDKMAAGDSVTAKLKVTNSSNISIKYRAKLVSDDTLTTTLSNTLDTKWTLAMDKFEKEATLHISLPAAATEGFDGEKTVSVVVEAVQGNAEVIDDVANFEELSSNDFSFSVAEGDAITVDGRGASVSNWADAWFASDLTVKNVTFLQGATFSANVTKMAKEHTITFENCTFYACQQEKIDIDNWTSIHGGTNLNNSGDGLCLDVETDDSDNKNTENQLVNVVVKGCKFIGENDVTLDRNGYKYYDITNKTWTDKSKGRGHAVAINAINGQGGAKSVTIENNEMTGIRGNCIQLYTFNYPITVANNKINSWGKNNLTAKMQKDDAAIRGTQGTGTLTLTSNYFGMDENKDASGNGNLHVNVNDYSGNTDGTRKAGTY